MTSISTGESFVARLRFGRGPWVRLAESFPTRAAAHTAIDALIAKCNWRRPGNLAVEKSVQRIATEGGR
jgi:hypothetical protein